MALVVTQWKIVWYYGVDRYCCNVGVDTLIAVRRHWESGIWEAVTVSDTLQKPEALAFFFYTVIVSL